VADEYLETMVDKFVLRVKRGLLYTEAGVWLELDEGRRVARVGLSDYRQTSGGDVAFVELAEPGTHLAVDGDLAHLETIKADIVVPCPVEATVVSTNADLGDQPELVNQEPYGAGWLSEIAPAAWPPAGLLDAEAYMQVMTAQAREKVGK
jgi:glycine cleavage system H protein